MKQIYVFPFVEWLSVPLKLENLKMLYTIRIESVSIWIFMSHAADAIIIVVRGQESMRIRSSSYGLELQSKIDLNFE